MSILNNSLLLGADAAAGGYQISRSVRFNSSDSAYLSRTPASSSNRKTWTWAGWVKRSGLGSLQMLMATSTADNTQIYFGSDDTLIIGSSTLNQGLATTAVYRDVSAWYHIVIATDTTLSSDRNRIYVNGSIVAASGSGGFSQNANTAFNSTTAHNIGRRPDGFYFSGYLADIHFIDGQALDPSSFTEFDDNGVLQPKAYEGTYGTNGFHLPFSDNSTAAALGTDTSGNGNTWTVNNFSVGSTVNRVAECNNVNDFYGNPRSTWARTLFNGLTGDKGPIPAAGTPMIWTPSSPITLSGSGLRIWVARNGGGSNVFINGTSVASTEQQFNSYGTTYSPLTSIEWRTIDGSTFSQLSAIEVNGSLLIDSSFNSGNDSLVDSPVNGSQVDTGVGGEVVGNYCTWNPLALVYNTPSLSNGNLDSANNSSVCVSTIGIPPTGKWYCEVSGTGMTGGICPIPRTTQIEYNIGGGVTGVIGIAVNRDADEVKLYKDNVLQSTTSISGAGIPTSATVFIQSYAGGTLNAGQRPFAYTAPSGFKALCTTNLPEPTIADGSTAMDVALYTGNGSTQTISGLNFSPDLVWIKRRDLINYFHELHDIVRGTSKALFSNSTVAESARDTLTSFNSDGFTVGTQGGVHGGTNASGGSYIAWTWDAGSSTVTNTAGSITSQVRANASAGFSVVTFTAQSSGSATIGHGLGVDPVFIIVKSRAAVYDWVTYHVSNGNTKAIRFTTEAANTSSGWWGNTSPTSTVFTLGNSYGGAGNSVAYCFAPVAGYSSFGSYTGNGSASGDGPFVFCNFRPRFILTKRTNSTNNWTIVDAARNSYNVSNTALFPNLFAAESTNAEYAFDILSNGFKVRGTPGDSVNVSGGTYIYIAFASHPFATSRAR